MGRELQKKKNRSSNPKIKLKPKKRANPRTNPIIAANWDDKQTLTQNYRRLGLAARLNAPAGGVETKGNRLSRTSTEQKLGIANANSKVLTASEARVERDPETGKIIRVVQYSDRRIERRMVDNPLGDLIVSSSEEEDEDDDDDGGEFEGFGDEDEEMGVQQTEVVRQLEEEASKMPAKRVRKQSQREIEWIERLVEKYKEDYGRMARDRRLNPMQQTEADIARRIRKWKASRDGESIQA